MHSFIYLVIYLIQPYWQIIQPVIRRRIIGADRKLFDWRMFALQQHAVAFRRQETNAGGDDYNRSLQCVVAAGVRPRR